MIQPPSGPPSLFHTLYTTRSLRRFRSDPVPDDVLFQIFDAAIRAPSGQNAQDWRFVVVRDDAVKTELQRRARERWAQYQPRFAARPELLDELPRTQRLSLKSLEHLTRHLASVPVVVVACTLAGRHSKPAASIYPAVQNLLLAARGLGVAGCIFNIAIGDPDSLRALIGIPDSNEIHCLLPLGYPSDRHGPVRRKPVREVVYDGRYGQPWAFAGAQPNDGWQSRWMDPD